MTNKCIAEVKWNGNHLYSGQLIEGEHVLDESGKHYILYTETYQFGNVLRDNEKIEIKEETLRKA